MFDVMIVGSGPALLRAESRGAHFRIDAPEPDPIWRGRIVWRRGHLPAFEEVQSA
jgi:succinate dehydrogenase/fumarate reductase flavoprotein subunit